MPYHRPTLDRLDAEDGLPAGRHELIRSIGRHSPDTLSRVDEALTRSGIPEEYHLDVGYELLNNDAPEEADIGPYIEPQMSTTGRVIDTLGKLIGGIGAGLSERDGNAAFAASDFIRDLTRDQQRERALARHDWDERRRVGLEQRRAGREEQRWQWEKGTQEYELSKRDPNSPASQAARDANIAVFQAGFPGQQITPEMMAKLESSNAEQIDAITAAMGSGVQRAYEEKRDAIEDQMKREQMAATQGLAAAQQASQHAYQQATLGMQRERMDREQEAAARERQDEMRRLFDEIGPEGMREMGYPVPGEAPAGTAAPEQPLLRMQETPVPSAAVRSAATGTPRAATIPSGVTPESLQASLPPRARRELAAKRAQQEQEFLVEERAHLPQMIETEKNLRQLGTMLRERDISGPIRGVIREKFPAFAQMTMPDQARAQLLIDNIIVARAKTFGAAPSEGERRAIADSIMNFYLPEGGNVANIVRHIDTLLVRQERATGIPRADPDLKGRPPLESYETPD